MSITPQTRLCISLAARPGGFGVAFHNFLYRRLALDFIYKSCTTTDLAAAIAGVRALGIRGCGISMPFKEAAAKLLDSLSEDAREIGAVNTIVNDSGALVGHNTDFLGMRAVLQRAGINSGAAVAVAGSGGMARAVLHALKDAGFNNVTVLARNKSVATPLAHRYGYRHLSLDARDRFQCLINATSVGMGEQTLDVWEPSKSAFSLEQIEASETVIDCVAVPKETALLKHARRAGKKIINGFEITCEQGRHQFALYTGVQLSDSDYAAAVDFCSLR